MKVQLQGQTLRLRIDERELTALLAGGLIANLTRFGQGSGWGMELFLHEGSCVRLQAAEALRVWLPREDVAALQARLPSRDGLVFEIGQGADALEIRFDVDVRDSVRQRGVARAAPMTASQA